MIKKTKGHICICIIVKDTCVRDTNDDDPKTKGHICIFIIVKDTCVLTFVRDINDDDPKTKGHQFSLLAVGRQLTEPG